MSYHYYLFGKHTSRENKGKNLALTFSLYSFTECYKYFNKLIHIITECTQVA